VYVRGDLVNSAGSISPSEKRLYKKAKACEKKFVGLRMEDIYKIYLDMRGAYTYYLLRL